MPRELYFLVWTEGSDNGSSVPPSIIFLQVSGRGTVGGEGWGKSFRKASELG